MKTCNRILCALALSLGTVVSLIPSARATTLTYTNQHLEMMLCFRQVGTANPFDLEVNIGSVTNLMALSAGATITNTNFSFLQLSNAMAAGTFDNAEFSVTAAVFAGNTTGFAAPADTVWVTIPRANPAAPNTPWTRESKTVLANAASPIYDIGNLAASYSGLHASDPLVNNNPVVGIPPGSAYSCENDLGLAGDLNGGYFTIVENFAPSPFTTPIVSDFFMEVPSGFADPLNSNATGGNTDYLGYFTFYPSGMLTFTRAGANLPPAPTLNIARAGAINTISFSTTSGATYNLIYTNLSGITAPRSNWFPLGSAIIGNGGPTNFTDNTAVPNRIYSVTAH